MGGWRTSCECGVNIKQFSAMSSLHSFIIITCEIACNTFSAAAENLLMELEMCYRAARVRL